MRSFLLVCAAILLTLPESADNRHFLNLKPKKPKTRPPPCNKQTQQVCPGSDPTCFTRTCIHYFVNSAQLDRTCQWTTNCLTPETTCVCNGYAYDMPTRECVLPKYCSTWWWNKASQTEQTAMADLIEKTGGYGIIRYNDNKNYLVGKLNLADGSAWPIAHTNDKEFEIKPTDSRFSNVEMLCALPKKSLWLLHNKTDGRRLPHDAVFAGYVYPKKEQYIGRADTSDNQLMFPGKVENGVLHQVYTANNTVLTTNQFMVLSIHSPKRRRGGATRGMAQMILISLLSINITFLFN